MKSEKSSFRRLLAALLIVLLAAAASAFDIPAAPSGRISDYAGILSKAETGALESRLKSIEDATSSQFVVALFPSLGGESLEELSIRIADKWKAGQKGRDNGLLLLVFMEERKVRVEVGKGLEGVIPDILAGRVIRDVLAPSFKAGRHAEGLAKAIDAFDAAAKGEFEPLPDKKKESSKNHFPFVIFLILFFVIAGIRSRGTRVIGRRGGFYGGPFIGGGFGGGGGGGFGGFGGGGGSFGGGGASGGW